MKPQTIVIALLLVAFGYGSCYLLNPQTIALEDYQALNQDMVDRLKAESCAEPVLEIRNELEAKFQTALNEREIQCGQWEVCDCKENVTIIESNCDTTELEGDMGECLDVLEDCTANNELLSKQLSNFMYE